MGIKCYDNKSGQTKTEIKKTKKINSNEKKPLSVRDGKVGHNSNNISIPPHPKDPESGPKKDKKSSSENKKKESEEKKMKNNGGNSYNDNLFKKKKNDQKVYEIDGSCNKNNNISNIINNSQNKKSIPLSYPDLNKDKDYHLLCPDCNDHYPTIRDISYDLKKNDFVISYECDCFNNKEIRKSSNMKNFIINKKPSDESIFFLSREKKNEIYNLLEKYKEVFQEYQIVKNIIDNDVVTDMSVAPIAEFKSNMSLRAKINSSKNISINQENPNFKESYFKSSYINRLANKESNLEISENLQINDDFNNLDKNTFKKKYNKSKLSSIKEDKEENYIKYRRNANIKGNYKKILSIIQLESGDIAFGTSDRKIIIWNIIFNSLINQIEDNGNVNCLLEFKNNFLLSGNSINEIFLWDINSNINCISKFSGHQKSINSLVKCLDNFFASASNDGTIKIWNYEQKKELGIKMAHEGAVLCMILLKNGDLCSGSEDNTIKIWDWQNGILKKTIDTEQNSIRCLYELNDGTLLSGSNEKKIQIWKEFIKIKEIEGHDCQINSLYQINENNFVSCSDNIKIWELNNFTCCQILTDHDKNVTGIIKLKDNNLASCSEDTTIIIWTQC